MRSIDPSADALAVLSGRAALEVRGNGLLAVGSSTASFDPGDVTSLLTAHLTLVRKVRRQQREAAILLRRDDVVALAELVGESTAEVIERLGALMGATRKQRAAMSTLFAAGALVVGLASTGAVFGHGGSKGAGAAASPVPVESAAATDSATVFEAAPTNSTITVELVEPISPSIYDQLLRLSLDDVDGSRPRSDAVAGAVVLPPTVEAPAAETPSVAAAPTASPVPEAPAVPAVAEVTPAPADGALDAAPTYDTDPSLVDIGTPPIPEPREVIEEPTLVADPPAPGFEVG